MRYVSGAYFFGILIIMGLFTISAGSLAGGLTGYSHNSGNYLYLGSQKKRESGEEMK